MIGTGNQTAEHFGSTMEWSNHATGTFNTTVCRFMKVKESVAVAVAGNLAVAEVY